MKVSRRKFLSVLFASVAVCGCCVWYCGVSKTTQQAIVADLCGHADICLNVGVLVFADSQSLAQMKNDVSAWKQAYLESAQERDAVQQMLTPTSGYSSLMIWSDGKVLTPSAACPDKGLLQIEFLDHGEVWTIRLLISPFVDLSRTERTACPCIVTSPSGESWIGHCAGPDGAFWKTVLQDELPNPL